MLCQLNNINIKYSTRNVVFPVMRNSRKDYASRLQELEKKETTRNILGAAALALIYVESRGDRQ